MATMASDRPKAKLPARPKMQARAISEMGPLYNPPSDDSSRDLGQGTRSSTGRSKVKAGSRLPRGALAPLSPFLPMPPAPTSEELKARDAREREEGLRTPRPDDHHIIHKSSTIKGKPKASPQARLLQAQGMLRSYSTPVATQKEYDAQCRAFDARIEAEGSDGLLISSGWPATTASFAAHREQRRHAAEAAASANALASASISTAMAPSASQHSHANKTRRQGMSPLAVNATLLNSQGDVEDIEELRIDIKDVSTFHHHQGGENGDDAESYFGPPRFMNGETPSPACSEGPATPKAIAPMGLMPFSPISDGGKAAQGQDVFDDGDFLIHPDHLAPPPL